MSDDAAAPKSTGWIDVTRTLDDRLVCWPGRRPPDVRWEKRVDRGDHCNVSAWSLVAHTGTHIDAPLHFVDGGKSIDQIPLDTLTGECTVFDISDRAPPIFEAADARSLGSVQRLLIKTFPSGAPAHTNFPRLLTPDAATILLDRGLVLIGTDRLSVDISQPDFAIHHLLLGAGCVIVEGLELSQIVPGAYDLCALPLPVAGAEASPARVLLRRK